MNTSPAAALDTLSPTIPVFPLSGALLLPRGELPLHVFEQRYRDMVRDSAAGHGLIGMVQPTQPESTADRPDLYGTGCVGRMSALRQTDDGRYYMTLIGLCRYDIVEELPMTHAYREVVADYRRYLSDIDPAEPDATDREKLLSALQGYLDAQDLETDWGQMDRVDEETLVNALAMMCPFDPREKQALLEAGNIRERSEILTSLFTMSGHAARGATPSSMQ